MATATCAKARTSAASSSSDAPARPARSNGMTVRFGPALLRRLTTEVVGRRRELEVIVAALAAGRHLLLEGPPGTGKSTVLRSRSEEHTSELKSLMRISYAVFCLKK